MLQAVVASRRLGGLFGGGAVALLMFGCMPPPSQLAAAEALPVSIPGVDGLRGLALEAAATVVAALGAWVLTTLRKRLALAVDGEYRGYLLPAVQAGLDFAFSHPRLRGADLDDPEQLRELVEEATSYVFRRVPDAAKHFGLDRPAMAELIQARLPILLGPDATPDAEQLRAGAVPLGRN